MEKNLNLLRKIAWSFHRTTGLDWDDLFQQAALSYCEGLRKYDPSRGKLTTFMWCKIINDLKLYLKAQEEWKQSTTSIENIDKPIQKTNLFESFSNEAQQVAKIILRKPVNFTGKTPKEARLKVIKTLISAKWAYKKISIAFKDLQLALYN